jgi:hypothetical protein
MKQASAAKELAKLLGPIPCPNCPGTGEVIDYKAAAKYGHTSYIVCPVCHGKALLCRGCARPISAGGALCERCLKK